jgi:hypothetical protein
MVIERRNQNRRFKLNGIFLRNINKKEIEITALCRYLNIVHSSLNIFPVAQLMIQTEESLSSFIESGDTIRISYATGLMEDYFETREFLFKINAIPSNELEKSTSIQNIKFDLVDHRLYDLMNDRFNKTFVNKTKSEMLNEIFKYYELNINVDITDNNKYTYYCRNANILEDINIIRYLGDEPSFIYERNNNTDIYVRERGIILNSPSTFRFDLSNVIGTNDTDRTNNIQGSFRNLYNGQSSKAGYILYNFDVDTKTPSYINKGIDNDVFYPQDRINNIKTLHNSLYLEDYYFNNTLVAKYSFSNTNLKIGDCVEIRNTAPYNSSLQTSDSGKYFIYCFEENINFEKLLLEQSFTFVR